MPLYFGPIKRLSFEKNLRVLHEHVGVDPILLYFTQKIHDDIFFIFKTCSTFFWGGGGGGDLLFAFL